MAEDKKEGKPEGKPEFKKEKKAINIIRIAETDINGEKTVAVGIRKIKGVGFMFSHAVAHVCPFADKKIGELSENEIKQLEEIISNPEKHNIPSWQFDRRKDPESGVDRHISVSQMQFIQRMDINKLKKMKCYRGVRHSLNLPVRGQRTRGSFRKGKSVGVSKKKAKGGK